jgi:uncharacterized protein (TIGR02391 family)
VFTDIFDRISSLMNKTLKDFLPPSEVLIELEPEEVAPNLLMYLNYYVKQDNNRNKVHISQHLNESNSVFAGYAGMYRDQVLFVLAEAWGWLVQQNFLCPDPTESHSNGWLFISRRGKTIQSTDDFKKYTHISLLPRNVLDPELNKKVWPSFIDGDFDTAIFAAFKEVEVRMRTTAGLDTSHIGVNLARKVFNPENGQLTEKLNPDKGEKVVYMELFAGSIGVFKNPGSHRPVDYDNPVTVVSLILFANTLLQIIEKRRPGIGYDDQESGVVHGKIIANKIADNLKHQR